ncbi:ferritin-like domain-containing protein [Niastella sp. MAH-29]|uniref:Ferritin-like domain-containing protein n=2 Tax=Chitinophagaceae TaxID=563835 RepID=A0ABS3YN42_9BACT|nr:ferritin-like domain-containing protein [Niastella soli]
MERGRSSKSHGATKTSRSSSNKTSESMGKKDKSSLLKDFFVEQLQDIYWAEKALVKELPKMQGATTTEELAEAITEHVTETQEHISRLEEAFEMMGETARAKKCEAMEGLIKEAHSIINETQKGSATRDAAIIMAAQKVEHYEIATYGSLVQLAKTIGLNDVAELLGQTLAEEKNCDQVLTQIAEGNINEEGAREEEGEQQMEEGNEGEED